jgi:hypothetical protein
VGNYIKFNLHLARGVPQQYEIPFIFQAFRNMLVHLFFQIFCTLPIKSKKYDSGNRSNLRSVIFRKSKHGYSGEQWWRSTWGLFCSYSWHYNLPYLWTDLLNSSPRYITKAMLQIKIKIQNFILIDKNGCITNIKQIRAHFNLLDHPIRGRRGRDRMVIGFTTTCTISAYHHIFLNRVTSKNSNGLMVWIGLR